MRILLIVTFSLSLFTMAGCSTMQTNSPSYESPSPSPQATTYESVVEEGWIRYGVRDIGSLDYPPNFLELQSGNYKEYSQEMSRALNLPATDFILQQVGLNELNPAALKEYRRVIFSTTYLKPDEIVYSHHEKYASSRQELSEIQNAWIDQSRQGFAQQKSAGLGDNRFVDPGSLEIVEVNGMFPMLWIYKRQLNENPVVLVKQYLFFDFDKLHKLIFSYRVVDERECSDIYEKILYSFRLQN